jgi:hypothetical protein
MTVNGLKSQYDKMAADDTRFFTAVRRTSVSTANASSPRRIALLSTSALPAAAPTLFYVMVLVSSYGSSIMNTTAVRARYWCMCEHVNN